MKKNITLIQNKAVTLLFALALLFPLLSIAQPRDPDDVVAAPSIKAGTIKYLAATNGFSAITLGTDASKLPNYKLAYLDAETKFDADSCLKFEYKDTSILKAKGDLYLDLVGLRTYQGKVVNIYVFFNKKDGYKVLNNFLNDYGMFTSRPNAYQDIYNWDSNQLSLTLRYELNTDLGVAIFTSKDLERDIAVMKERKKFREQFEAMNAQYSILEAKLMASTEKIH